jgi:DNA repair protein RecN (Recombination protein N)
MPTPSPRAERSSSCWSRARTASAPKTSRSYARVESGSCTWPSWEQRLRARRTRLRPKKAREQRLSQQRQSERSPRSSASELRDLTLRLREVGSDLHRFLASLESDPAELEEIEGSLDRIADLKRRFRCSSYEELLERAEAARVELEESQGVDPVEAAAEAVAAAEVRMTTIADDLYSVRAGQTTPFAESVADELSTLGMGEGEFLVEQRERELGPTGRDEVSFLVRANPGLPFAPVAETASGGELSRIALALAAVAGGQTLVFDEIDAGIGGVTAHAVAATLQRLAERAQVLTITHLPQIASVADRHYRVEKVPGDPTHTRIDELDDAVRRDELERMLGGQEFLTSLKEA